MKMAAENGRGLLDDEPGHHLQTYIYLHTHSLIHIVLTIAFTSDDKHVIPYGSVLLIVMKLVYYQRKGHR